MLVWLSLGMVVFYIPYILKNGWSGWVSFIGSWFYASCSYGLIYWLDSTQLGVGLASIVYVLVYIYSFNKLHECLENKY